MTSPLIPADHHHPAGMTCFVCIVLGIDVAPTEVQAGHIRLSKLTRKYRETKTSREVAA